MDKRITVKNLHISGISKNSLYPGTVGEVIGVNIIKWNIKDTSDTSIPTLCVERICFKVKYDTDIVYITLNDVIDGYYEVF